MTLENDKKVVIIGAGFAGLSAAITAADHGYDVTLLEKNDQPGGRASVWKDAGFTFDLGPSWYWMPDIFEKFFRRFGKSVEDYYKLKRLDPSYRVYFSRKDYVDLPANMEEMYTLYESLEPGASDKLKTFLQQAEYKYNVGMNDYVRRPSYSITEFIDAKVLSQLFKIQMFSSLRSHVRKLFKNERIREILEFPVLFLGASPANTPAMYSLMNYADIKLGTWYPEGGMGSIVKALVKLAEEKGVNLLLNQNVKKINIKNGKAHSVTTDKNEFNCAAVIAASDYQHTEQKLLDEKHRTYTSKYWETRKLAPSSLLFYLGINKKLNSLQHHTLFFHESYDQHASEIYSDPKWPSKPLFYVSAASKTDSTVSPDEMENLVVLMPLAPGIEDTSELREKYYDIIINKFEEIAGESIAEHVILKRSYCIKDFEKDYNSFKGNAYGLANVLLQTAFFKPKLKSKKVSNLYFAGQLTTPGPGVPPSLISGQIAADEIAKVI